MKVLSRAVHGLIDIYVLVIIPAAVQSMGEHGARGEAGRAFGRLP